MDGITLTDGHPQRIVVKFRRETPANERAALHRKNGHRLDRILPQLDMHVLSVPPGRSPEAMMEAYRHHPMVEFVEEDQILEPALIPNDPWYANPYVPAWHLPKISAPAAWDLTTGSEDVIIGIIDSGVDSTHPDLAAKIVPGWNVYDNNSDTSDVGAHGTAVAGQAAAIGNNGIGVTSPAWGCPIMPIRATSPTGLLSTSTVASAIVWAADHGARVANVSSNVFGSSTATSAAQYLWERGGIVLCAAGNSGTYLVIADNPYMVTVNSTDQNDLVPSWSCVGNPIDVSAPGVGILTTAPGGDYSSGTGTSASAPIVAGIAALVISVNPRLAGRDIEGILKQSADDLGAPGWDPYYGWGRVNAARAVQMARDFGAPPQDTVSPTVAVMQPTGGAVLAGTVAVSVGAADNTGVSRVDLYVDSSFVSSDTASPHQWSYDSTRLPDGTHSFWAAAFDSAGNRGESARVSVSFDNVPNCDTVERPGTTCADGLDNDCDTRTDCNDADCATDASCVPPDPCVGNGVCETGEDCRSCANDCPAGSGAACGNGVCETLHGENCQNCPADCNGRQSGPASQRFCCGNGGGQNPKTCADPRCTATGFACSSLPAVESCCGDGTCNGIETSCNCGLDCGPADSGEMTGSTCRDGLDNDCDGDADCSDRECASDTFCPHCDGDGVCEPGENCFNCSTDCKGRTKVGSSSSLLSGSRFCCGNGTLESAEGDGTICNGNP